jgi:hypothetical protein
MTGRIYVIDDDGGIRAMEEQRYASEDLLQTLLEDHPELLAGDLISPTSPREWLLVSREPSVPGEEDGGARWFLDHLFVDQEAIPTLVEVKRSTDTRIRREVVGQMLDYAANAVVYWPPGSIRRRFEETCVERGEFPDEVIHGRFDLVEGDVDAFWDTVETNLRSKKIRLLFVADEIPAELRRIIEFLNESMPATEVLGIELKQFTDGQVKTLVPSVIGHTSAAEQAKGSASRSGTVWSRSRLKAWLTDNEGAKEAIALSDLLTFAEREADDIGPGSGIRPGFSFRLNIDGRPRTLWSTRSAGADRPLVVEFGLGYLKEAESPGLADSYLADIKSGGGNLTILNPDQDWPRVELGSLSDKERQHVKDATARLKSQLH